MAGNVAVAEIATVAGKVLGRPKQEEPTKQIRVYESQAELIQQLAGALGESVAEFAKKRFSGALRDAAIEASAAIARNAGLPGKRIKRQEHDE